MTTGGKFGRSDGQKYNSLNKYNEIVLVANQMLSHLGRVKQKMSEIKMSLKPNGLFEGC